MHGTGAFFMAPGLLPLGSNLTMAVGQMSVPGALPPAMMFMAVGQLGRSLKRNRETGAGKPVPSTLMPYRSSRTYLHMQNIPDTRFNRCNRSGMQNGAIHPGMQNGAIHPGMQNEAIHPGSVPFQAR